MPGEISEWDNCYISGELPWDSRRVSPELQCTFDEYSIPRGRALELGCGTGTNAIFLVKRGFEVTAIDFAPAAVEQARQHALAANVTVNFQHADVRNFSLPDGTVDFVFDRGCYHCVRQGNLGGYLRTLHNVSHPGTWILILAGNVKDQSASGIPRVSEQQIRDELAAGFPLIHLREHRFEEADGSAGPIGWSTLLRVGNSPNS